MNRFQSVSLKRRFTGISLVFVLTVLGLSAYALRVNDHQNQSLNWAGRVFTAHESLHAAQESITNARRGARTYLLYGDVTGLTQYANAMAGYDAEFGLARGVLAVDEPSIVPTLDRLESSVRAWQTGDADVGIALRQDWTGSEADLQSATLTFAQSPESKALFDSVTDNLTGSITDVSNGLVAHVTDIQNQNRRLTWIVITTLGLLLAFSAAITAFLYRGIARPVARLSEAAHGIVAGDFSRRTGIAQADEIGRAAVAFDAMAGHIQKLVAGLESAQLELFDRESRLTTILANVGDAILIVDPTGKIVQANAAAKKLFEFDGVAFEGESIERFIVKTEDMNVLGEYRELQSGPTKRDVRAFKASGASFPAESTASRAWINGAWHVVLCLRDMSERVATEQALRRGIIAADRARLLTRSVIDAANDVMLLVSSDREVVLVNRRHEHFFGIADGDVLNRNLTELASVYDRIFVDPAPILANIKRGFRDDEAPEAVVVTQKWPSHRELNLITLPIRGREHEIIGTLCVLRDISAEREADRLKSDFLSLVSHELRTPLTSIRGYVDLLLEGDAGEISAQQTEFLEIVAASSSRLVELTNDLLDVSQIEAGRLRIQPTLVDAASHMRSILASFRPQFARKMQTLTSDIPDDLPEVLVEAIRFDQIFANLISNANKYTQDGGTISARAFVQAGFVRFEVKDDGAGIAAEEQSRLFSRFYRVRNRATRKVGGTGLGLAIAKSLVEAHGGAIGLVSAPGEGATFFFTLPIAQTDQTPTRPNRVSHELAPPLVAGAEPVPAALDSSSTAGSSRRGG